MKLRKKTFLSLSVLALFSMFILFVLLRQTMIKSILELEKEDHVRNVQRVVDAIDEDNKQLVLKLADFSTWDDSYRFVKDLNPGYIKSNLDPSMFETLGIDAVIFLDSKNNVRFSNSKGGIANNQKDPEFQTIRKLLAERHDLFKWKDGNEFKIGFLRSGDKLLQFCARGIVNSSMTLAPNGTLIYLKFFDSARTERLSEVTHYGVTSRLLTLQEVTKKYSPQVKPLSEEIVEGSAVLPDLFGQNLVELKVQAPRLIYKQSQKNLFVILLLVASLCLAIMIAVLFLIDRLLVSRLLKINRLISGTKRDSAVDTIPQLKDFGDDEVGLLSSKIHDLYNQVRKLADFDELTGLHNIRYFRGIYEKTFKLAKRHNRSFALMICDVDFFKKVNDEYGHLQGDMVLRTLGGLLKKHTRATDICARYGGEEFVLLLNETDEQGALVLAEKLRLAVEALEIPLLNKNMRPLKCTMSLGITTYSAKVATFELMLAQADKALYMAKSSGRNRSVFLPS